MLKLLVFGLIIITLILVSIFIGGLMDLYKQELEEKKNMVRDGIEGYLDQTFGFRKVKVFKTLIDADGYVRYMVYLPQFEWFKSPTYTWYEVYQTQSGGFQHIDVEK
ncbi:hypothetical protein [Neobacillus cucumis]|uniref:DUF3139 domain-containing protein n=1 Tax=Neobacillus cucumis TaxID=1740721 RepID=A0A2N5H8P0_9BACI|nr:hypothetical protein [Neobacillus cucumis]PLS01865.1 hypothetical protein CVD27_23235 [Neobacillus cucumis]